MSYTLRYYSNGEIKPLFRGLFILSFLFLIPFLSLIMFYYCSSLEEVFYLFKYLGSVSLYLFLHSIYHIPNWKKEVESEIKKYLNASFIFVILQSWNPISYLYLKNTNFQLISDFISVLFFILIINNFDSYRYFFYLISGSVIVFYFDLFMPYLDTFEFNCILYNYLLIVINFYNLNHKIFDFIPDFIGYYEIFEICSILSIWFIYLTNLHLMIRS